jgi:glutamate N-acetyltransferase/amino-acid N-acetyltransferase
VFTRNKVKAAPVLWSQQVLDHRPAAGGRPQLGGANACTGPEGFQTAHATAEKAADVARMRSARGRRLFHRADRKQLPREAVLAGVEAAASGARRRRRRGAGRRHRDHDHGHRREAGRHTDDTGWSIGGTTKAPG